MILQSLNRLYDRLAAEPEYGLAPPGYSLQKISFVIVIHPDGRLHEIQSLRDENGRERQILVPGGDKPRGSVTNKSVHKKTGFLRNDSAFLLGRRITTSEDSLAEMEFQAFKKKHLEIESDINDKHFSAVCQFLRRWRTGNLTDNQKNIVKGGVGIFKLIGEQQFVHERQAVRTWWNESQQGKKNDQQHVGICLVTGKSGPIAKTHEPNFKGVEGGQSSGSLLVSYNRVAFESYGKKKSFNASVSEEAAFKYCTALNTILSGPRRSKHVFVLRDPKAILSSRDKKRSTTIVFWTERKTVTEDWLVQFLSGDMGAAAQDDTALNQMKMFLQALRSGGGELRALGDDPATPVHVLGLAPNAGRLSVRFWHTGSLGELFDKLKVHHDALSMYWCRDPCEWQKPPEFPPLWMLLRETARESKDIPPLLGGALLRAVIGGGPYPEALAAAVVRRIRADRNVNYLRAAILKAWLTRHPNRQGEIPVSLDIQRSDPAYRLGRLFAVLEKTQEDAQPGINATIRDRFYSAASATPAVVFPRLLRTYQHHLAKLPVGQKIGREKLVQEIMDGIDSMPAHLRLQDQALFAIGYYQQRKALFTKMESETDNQE